jgi:hypothetical protein
MNRQSLAKSLKRATRPARAFICDLYCEFHGPFPRDQPEASRVDVTNKLEDLSRPTGGSGTPPASCDGHRFESPQLPRKSAQARVGSAYQETLEVY